MINKGTQEYRKFGIVFSVIILIIFYITLPLLNKNTLSIWPICLTTPILILALTYPNFLKYIYLFWMKLGEILNFINTRIILTLIFFTLFLPISIFFKIIGRDRLETKINKTKMSYKKIPDTIKVSEQPY